MFERYVQDSFPSLRLAARTDSTEGATRHIWHTKHTYLAYQAYISGIPSIHVWHTKHTYPAYQAYVSGIPSIHIWHTKHTYLAYQAYISGIPSIHVWHTKHTYLAYQAYVSGIPSIHFPSLNGVLAPPPNRYIRPGLKIDWLCMRFCGLKCVHLLRVDQNAVLLPLQCHHPLLICVTRNKTI